MHRLNIHVYLIMYIILLSVIILFYQSPYYKIFALSPSFTYQEIKDDKMDWISMVNFTHATGKPLTDIVAVNSFSDGHFLNATFWLSTLLYEFPTSTMPSNITDSSISYGILIDSDFSNKTGRQGADFNIEIETNMSKSQQLSREWMKKFEQRSSLLPVLSTSETRTIYLQPINTGIIENQKNFVQISVDLGSIGYPSKYRAVFYSLQKIPNKPWIADFTNWINIPPPEIEVSTNPSSIVLRPGENKSISLQVKSTTGFQPTVYFSNGTDADIQLNFPFSKLNVPSSGIISTPLNISVSETAKIHPYTIPLYITSNVPTQPYFVSKKFDTVSVPPNVTESESIIKIASLAVTVEPQLTTAEQFRAILQDWGILIGLRAYPKINLLKTIRLFASCTRPR
jgi:hypothetical protein